MLYSNEFLNSLSLQYFSDKKGSQGVSPYAVFELELLSSHHQKTSHVLHQLLIKNHTNEIQNKRCQKYQGIKTRSILVQYAHTNRKSMKKLGFIHAKVVDQGSTSLGSGGSRKWERTGWNCLKI